MDQYYCWRAHLNIVVGGPFKLVAKIKLRGPMDRSILLLGGPFKYYCKGVHLNCLAKIKLKGPCISITVGAHLNINVGGPL